MTRHPRRADLMLVPSLLLLAVLFYLPQLLLFVVSVGPPAWGGIREGIRAGSSG